jgi:hypothetical protein
MMLLNAVGYLAMRRSGSGQAGAHLYSILERGSSFAKATASQESCEPYTHKPFHAANFASRLIRGSYKANAHI